MSTNRRPVVTHTLLPLLLVAAVIFAVTRFTRIEAVIGDVVMTLQREEKQVFPAPQPGSRPAALELSTPAFGESTATPRNVVLILGDGMGIGHLSTASALLAGPHGRLAIEAAVTTALVKTSNGNELVSDSASAATSLATGLKTDTRMISRLPDGREPRTLFEAAQARGLATGMITTSGIVDATPAAFVTHAESRTDYRQILEGMLSSNVDILIGGDWRRYPRAAAQPDYVEAVQSVGSAADGRYTVVRDEDVLASAPIPLLALFPARPGSLQSYGPPLVRSARLALDRLSDTGSGFVLVVESEDTDEAAHGTDLSRLTAAMAELDEAVAGVLEFARGRDDTLVLVTADHDTGSPAIIGGEFADPVAEVRWLTRGHTATWVPLFAFGPGSNRFRGVLDSTEIPRIIGRLLELDRFPDADRNTPLVD
jgi:alkaline phosphatase